jgi:ectoine hydroxylase-related dioxygenase (phytanoyl-CoA dioxygenase family)
MNNFIKDQFSRAVNEKFINAHALGGSYIAKGKGEAGTLHPHQDWNIVDEELYRSFNIWVPLVDLHENNGAICIMPQSHLWDKTYRSANIPSIYQDQESDLWENMTKLYMKAGVALIYDHRLIHASGENKTDKLRLAAVFGIIPDEASMFYYHQKDSYTIEVYESNPDFFLLGNIFEGPKGLKKIDEFQYSQEILHKEKTYVVSQKKANLIDRIRALFK